MLLPIFPLLLLFSTTLAEDGCSSDGNCVCSLSHCSLPLEPPSPSELTHGHALHYSTSASGDRLAKTKLTVERLHSKWAKSRTGHRLSLTTTEYRQTIIGFGGAITDASVINIDNLPVELQQKLIESYFGPSGIGYTVARIPIASCDFSTREYSYLEKEGDFHLETFALAPDDEQKIKWTKKAKALAESEGEALKGGGDLKNGSEYSRTYANYLVRFIDEYTSAGVPIWGLTVQNEPSTGTDTEYRFQTMNMDPQMQASFVRDYLKPALRASNGGKNVSIMIHDDFRSNLPEWPDITLAQPGVEPLIDGIAVHWYGDSGVDPTKLSITKERHPRQFLLATEACVDDTQSVSLGNFSRGMWYARDIIEDLNHGVSGWVDWNIALDPQGGPNWVNNFVDSPIIVDKEKSVFYKQPMFYALGHFSRFIRPGAVVVGQSMMTNTGISAVAVKNVDKTIAVVLLNDLDMDVEVEIRDKTSSIMVPVKAQSINTVLYKGAGKH